MQQLQTRTGNHQDKLLQGKKYQELGMKSSGKNVKMQFRLEAEQASLTLLLHEPFHSRYFNACVINPKAALFECFFCCVNFAKLLKLFFFASLVLGKFNNFLYYRANFPRIDFFKRPSDILFSQAKFSYCRINLIKWDDFSQICLNLVVNPCSKDCQEFHYSARISYAFNFQFFDRNPIIIV